VHSVEREVSCRVLGDGFSEGVGGCGLNKGEGRGQKKGDEKCSGCEEKKERDRGEIQCGWYRMQTRRSDESNDRYNWFIINHIMSLSRVVFATTYLKVNFNLP